MVILFTNALRPHHAPATDENNLKKKKRHPVTARDGAVVKNICIYSTNEN